jgi:CheY-like chemotaxis protein
MRAGPENHVVLVIEDEPIVRTHIADEFRARGWHVIEAASGEQAVQLIGANRIDVVFTDITLAGAMSGWEAAEALRENVPDVPVLYTSGRPNDPMRQVKDSHFVGKPYDPAFVIEMCHSLLAETNSRT